MVVLCRSERVKERKKKNGKIENDLFSHSGFYLQLAISKFSSPHSLFEYVWECGVFGMNIIFFIHIEIRSS